MEVRITQATVIDFNCDGRMETLVPGAIMTLPDKQGEALINANLAFEVEDRAFETSDHPVAKVRKRR